MVSRDQEGACVALAGHCPTAWYGWTHAALDAPPPVRLQLKETLVQRESAYLSLLETVQVGRRLCREQRAGWAAQQ